MQACHLTVTPVWFELQMTTKSILTLNTSQCRVNVRVRLYILRVTEFHQATFSPDNSAMKFQISDLLVLDDFNNTLYALKCIDSPCTIHFAFPLSQSLSDHNQNLLYAQRRLLV